MEKVEEKVSQTQKKKRKGKRNVVCAKFRTDWWSPSDTSQRREIDLSSNLLRREATVCLLNASPVLHDSFHPPPPPLIFIFDLFFLHLSRINNNSARMYKLDLRFRGKSRLRFR